MWWLTFPQASFATDLLFRTHFANLVRLFFRNLSERKCCVVPRADCGVVNDPKPFLWYVDQRAFQLLRGCLYRGEQHSGAEIWE